MSNKKEMNLTSYLLTGKLVGLRGLREEDAQGDYYKWFNDREICRYNNHGRFPYTRALCLDYIKKVSSNDQDLVFAICMMDTDKHIGNIALQHINFIDKNAEYAIIIGDKKSWGKGVASEASHLIINHGFTMLNLNRIYCGTSSENIHMKGLADRIGFKKEGTQRQAFYKNGKFNDIFIYGLLKSEYKLLQT